MIISHNIILLNFIAILISIYKNEKYSLNFCVFLSTNHLSHSICCINRKLDSDMAVQSFLPLLTTLISLFFTISIFCQYSSRRKIYQFIWGTGLLIFSVTTLFEFISEIYGWNIPMYRAYYVLIASLVAILGLGTVYLFNRRAGGYLTLYFTERNNRRR